MVQQPVKVWVCKKVKPYTDFFITQNPTEARNARKKGFKCIRWKAMEEVENGN